MPTFSTPEPITATVDVVAGAVRLAAGDRGDTVVEVRPHDPSRSSDVRAAEQARIDFRHGKLVVSAGPKYIALGRGGAVLIDIALPSGSRLEVSSASADLHSEGLFGDCRFSSASGAARLDSVQGKLKADTASGEVTARSVVGNVAISTASGDAAVGSLDGDLKFQAASGGLAVGQLRGTLKAQTASGSVAVTAAASGGVTVTTSSGDVDLGIPEGTAARLDLQTRSGAVTNTLEPADGPSAHDETLTVHARTASGDISVRRAVPVES
jgi:hypothetical protein